MEEYPDPRRVALAVRRYPLLAALPDVGGGVPVQDHPERLYGLLIPAPRVGQAVQMPVVQKALEDGELIALGRLGGRPQGGDLEDVRHAVEAAGLLAGELVGHVQPGHALTVRLNVRQDLPHLPQQQGCEPGIPGGIQESV